MEKSKLEKRLKKISLNFKGETLLEVSVCDQGHYGNSYCGNCNYTLKEKDSLLYCPGCEYKFIGKNVTPSFGGSDF